MHPIEPPRAMKTLLPIAIIVATVTGLQAQTKPQVIARDAHSRTWQWETPIERLDGKTEMIQHGYVEVGSGICRWNDKEEKWLDASEVIEVFPGGAIGRSAQIQATFAPTLFGNINTISPDGNRITSQVLGLAFYDLALQKSVMIASVKDCAGAVLPPNQVIYRDAFDGGILADVIYTYKLGSFHQDIVLRSQLPVTPEDYEFNSDTTVLEVWTEMMSDREPRRVPQPAAAMLRP
ncbi:MAG: hypothetical protein HYZ36_03235, partial [Pedosphaera parvula]|nr:hypothetical protein [Pedosphaera parvula]